MKKHIKNILFVCTGNSCRSIMAEGYLRKRSEEAGLGLRVESAGIAALFGMPPSNETVEIMKEAGVDVSGYRSRRLEDDMVKAADMILVMEPHHRDAIITASPESEGKVYYLRDFDGHGADEMVPDPIGKGRSFYRNVFNVIKKSTEGLLKWLAE